MQLESKEIKTLLLIDSFPGDLCGFAIPKFKIVFFGAIYEAVLSSLLLSRNWWPRS